MICGGGVPPADDRQWVVVACVFGAWRSLAGQQPPQKMNYRHGYHAGNLADKRSGDVALVAIGAHLLKEYARFAVVSSHAAETDAMTWRGAEAGKTGEAQTGTTVGRARERSARGALNLSYAMARESDGYPGFVLAAGRQTAQPQDRLTAIEKHPEEFAALKKVLAPFRNAACEQADGYARTNTLLPRRIGAGWCCWIRRLNHRRSSPPWRKPCARGRANSPPAFSWSGIRSSPTLPPGPSPARCAGIRHRSRR